MKGLSLTLEVIVIAIALLVTVLVIITVFGGQIANWLNILNPWSQDVLAQNLCNQRCATWCQINSGSSGTDWGRFSVTLSGRTEPVGCDTIMSNVGSERCSCGLTTIGGGTTGGASGATCTVTTQCLYSDTAAGNKEVPVATTVCSSARCKVTCNTVDSSPTSKTGTCK